MSLTWAFIDSVPKSAVFPFPSLFSFLFPFLFFCPAQQVTQA